MAIGERLREARMRQKIDIADVEAATKIRAKYLRALENEEFALLPGHTFVKTFLRTYAEYLGLDPQLLLEEYRAEYEPRSEGELQPYSVAARQRPRERRRPRASSGPPGPGTAVIVVVGAIVVILLILGLTGGGGGSSKQAATTPAQGKNRTQPSRHRAPVRPRVTAVRLRVAPATATYLCVDRGPGTQPTYQGTTASPKTFRGRRLRVNAGNSLVRLTANGRRVRVPTGSTAIGYDFRLRRGKVRTSPIPLGQRPCA